jgi:GTP-binding protein
VIQSDPVEDFEKINMELVLYSPELLNKPMAVAGTKIDIAHDRIRLNRLKEYCRDKGLDFFPISSATGEGIKELVMYLAKRVKELSGNNNL